MHAPLEPVVCAARCGSAERGGRGTRIAARHARDQSRGGGLGQTTPGDGMNPDPNRLRDRTLALCQVESPTGDTADEARLYADWCRELGFEVEFLDDVFPATPTVVARLKSRQPGPTVVLNAHLDTVPIPHDPPRIDGERVYGRGSADMKGAAVSALEAAQL